ncbi:MAG: PDZ domain-containing protein, partial [Gammaproteobacteria bacterium]|nr:PDZ domain-containing protein [Gammaproteobacteria bacterium]
ALVSNVLPDAPAAKAGIQAGDIIVRFNGTELALSTDLPPLVGSTSVGQNIPLEFLRDGKTRQVTVTIGRLPESAPRAGGAAPKAGPEKGQFEDQLKFQVRALSGAELAELELKGPAVVVDKITPGPAAAAGLLAGDVLAQLNFKEIKTLQDLAAAIKSVPAGTKTPVLIYREGSPLFLALEVPKP